LFFIISTATKGQKNPPTRPPALQNPKPVVRAFVGYNSGANAHKIENAPMMQLRAPNMSVVVTVCDRGVQSGMTNNPQPNNNTPMLALRPNQSTIRHAITRPGSSANAVMSTAL
jgi:hypothetical protein